MASNGTILPSLKGVNGVAKSLNRADEVDDVSSDLPSNQDNNHLKFYSYSSQFDHL